MTPLKTYQQILLSKDLFLSGINLFFDKGQTWGNDPWIPPANIRGDHQGYLIEPAVPGAKKEEIKPEAENSWLIISGKPKRKLQKNINQEILPVLFAFRIMRTKIVSKSDMKMGYSK